MSNAKHFKAKEKPEKRKGGKGFKIFLLVWILIFVAFGAYALKYVNDTLKEMQANSLKQFIGDAVAAMGDDEIDKYFDYNRELESGSPQERVREFFKSGNFKVKQVPRTNTYNVYNDMDQLVLSADIEKVENVSKLGIFNYNILKLNGFTASENKELMNVEITAPSSYYVKAGDRILTADSTSYPEGFKDAGQFVKLPGESTYVLSNLTQWPDLKIYDERGEYDYQRSAKIYMSNDYTKYNTLEAAGCDFDALEFVKKWMKFMQNDLTGGHRGFDVIKKDLLEGTDQYEKARAWGSNVDITFVSDHTLKNPPFSGDKISNVVKYNDEAISVDVYMQMHMRLKTGVDRNPTFNSTLYLVKYDGAWRVVNIRSNEKQTEKQ